MGLGKLGQPVARQLAQVGYQVSGWSRSQKDLKDVTTFAGSKELEIFLNKTQILVCVLPLTTETEGILDLELFKQLKRRLDH